MMRSLLIDELPEYTPWVEKLLNSSNEILFQKTEQSVYREYEKDKWSAVWAEVQARQLGLEDVEKAQFGEKLEIAVSMGDNQLFVMRALEARRLLTRLVAERILAIHRVGGDIVELGAGTGTLAVGLAKDPRFAGSRFTAGDFSPSSIKIIQHLARTEGVSVKTGIFDFNSDENEIEPAAGSTVLLSFCISYMRQLDVRFWQKLREFKPHYVVVAEPICQFYPQNTLLGLLRKRYFEANDYGQNIWPSIEGAAAAGILSIQEVEKNAIGINPLCPVSFITLKFN